VLRRLGCPARWVSAGPDRSTSRFWRHLGARVGQRRRRHPPGGVGRPCRLLDGDVPYDFAPLRRGFSFYGRGGGRCWRPGCAQERENGDNNGGGNFVGDPREVLAKLCPFSGNRINYSDAAGELSADSGTSRKTGPRPGTALRAELAALKATAAASGADHGMPCCPARLTL
jgi:hypothetical protein